MIDTVFGIKVRMPGLCINRYRPIVKTPIIGRPIIALSVHLYSELDLDVFSLAVQCMCILLVYGSSFSILLFRLFNALRFFFVVVAFSFVNISPATDWLTKDHHSIMGTPTHQ